MSTYTFVSPAATVESSMIHPSPSFIRKASDLQKKKEILQPDEIKSNQIIIENDLSES